MKRTTTILAALAMSAASATAGPEPAPMPSGKGPAPAPMEPCPGPISYNNVELLYAYTDFDGDFDESHGGILKFEYSPASNFYIVGGIEYLNTGYDVDFVIPGIVPRGDIADSYSADIDQWNFTLGLGGHFPITSHIDIAVDGGAIFSSTSVDIDAPGDLDIDDDESEDDWGWFVRPHFRGKWGCFTAHLGAEYRDVSDFNEWAFFGSVYYQVAPAWDLTVGYRHGEDTETFTGGVRWRY
jgi:hypothetical protein